MNKQNIYQKRLEALRSALAAQGLDGAVISHPKHIFYFSGQMTGPSPSYLIITDQWVVGVAVAPIEGIETIQYVNYDITNGWDVWQNAALALAQALTRLPGRVGRLGLEANHLPASASTILQETSQHVFDLGDLLWKLRNIKDPLDMAAIQANVTINDGMFAAVRENLRAGMREMELWGLIYETMCSLNGEPFHLEGDIGGGIRGVDLGAQPTNERLQHGDAVFVDIYSSMHAYYADTTRVFVLGEPTQKQKEIHKVLEEALAAGEARLKPAMSANQVDAAVRQTITKAGYGQNYPHHSGHAYGLFQQERPFIIPAESMPLEEGMVLTLEPGIYIPGWGGMRIEGNYLIERDGARRLDAFPSQLIVCG